MHPIRAEHHVRMLSAIVGVLIVLDTAILIVSNIIIEVPFIRC